MSTAYERQLLDGILCQFAGVVAQTVEADERCDVRISWRVVASITVAVTEHELPLVWGRGVLLVPPQLKMKCPAVKLDTTERTHKKRAQALHPEEKVSILRRHLRRFQSRPCVKNSSFSPVLPQKLRTPTCLTVTGALNRMANGQRRTVTAGHTPQCFQLEREFFVGATGESPLPPPCVALRYTSDDIDGYEQSYGEPALNIVRVANFTRFLDPRSPALTATPGETEIQLGRIRGI